MLLMVGCCIFALGSILYIYLSYYYHFLREIRVLLLKFVKVHMILLHHWWFVPFGLGFGREKISLLYYFIIDVIICHCPSCPMTSTPASPTREWSISSTISTQTPPNAIFCGPPTTELNFQLGLKRKDRDHKDLILLSNSGERFFPNSKI